MPYLHCPRCHKTAWVRTESAKPVECRHCGRTLDHSGAGDVRLLTSAVRERFARDAALSSASRSRAARVR